MDRAGSRTLARGVRVRRYASGKQAIEIQFQYRGVTCKEVLSGLDPDRKGDQRFAVNLKAEVENAIVRKTFHYANYFPESKRARMFGQGFSNVTIETLLTDWLKDVERTHPHSTYRCYQKSCHAHLLPTFGPILARELTAQHIRQWIRTRTQTLKSIRNDLTPLRAVLDRALNDELIDRNPLDKIKVSRLVDRKHAKSGYHVDPLTHEEIDRVLSAAKEHDIGIANLLQFAFYSGLRTSELFGLQWRDIDWARGIAHIRRAVVERKLKETKTRAGNRQIVLLPKAREALKAQEKVNKVDTAFVFIRTKAREPFIDYEHLEWPWKTVLKHAGVRYRNPYQTRHTYASQLLSGGENPLFVAQQMGHKTTEMIMRHYGRWVDQSGPEERHEFVSNFGQDS